MCKKENSNIWNHRYIHDLLEYWTNKNFKKWRPYLFGVGLGGVDESEIGLGQQAAVWPSGQQVHVTPRHRGGRAQEYGVAGEVAREPD